MVMCVLSLITTMCVMYLSARAEDNPIIAMSATVCISAVALSWWCLANSNSNINFVIGIIIFDEATDVCGIQMAIICNWIIQSTSCLVQDSVFGVGGSNEAISF